MAALTVLGLWIVNKGVDHVSTQLNEYMKKKYEFKRQMTEIQLFFDVMYKQTNIDPSHPVWCVLNKLKSQYRSTIKIDEYLWIRRGDDMQCIKGYEERDGKYWIKMPNTIKSQMKQFEASEMKKIQGGWWPNQSDIKNQEALLKHKMDSLRKSDEYLNKNVVKGQLGLESEQVYLGIYPPFYPTMCNTFKVSNALIKYLPKGWMERLNGMLKIETEAETIKKFMLWQYEPVHDMADTLKALSLSLGLKNVLESKEGPLPIADAVLMVPGSISNKDNSPNSPNRMQKKRGHDFKYSMST